MKTVIIAGGQGTRIASVNSEIPKGMIPVAGKPIIEHELELCLRHGLSDFIFITGYLGDQIEAYFGDGKRWGAHITYFREEHPMGTAGALGMLKDLLQDDFFVLYGDTIVDIDMHAMLDFHNHHHADATLFVHPNDHPYDSDLVDIDVIDHYGPCIADPVTVWYRYLNKRLGFSSFEKHIAFGYGLPRRCVDEPD